MDLLRAEDSLAVRDGQGLDPRVRVAGGQDSTYVVADGVPAQVELVRDLLGGPTVREQVQDLGLAWCQVRVRLRRSCRLLVRHQAEHADDPAAVVERNRADLDLDA